MTIYKKDLQALNKDVKALSTKMEKLIKEFDKGKTAKVTKKATAKAKQKPAKLTATDKVLKIIRGSKRGVNAATLIKKTGFNQKRISNMIHRAFKAGKIKRVGKGIYVGA
jgi:predicted Rossmann fold nucleotide-binding protein DprA/Smf involved in DNA uptake